MRNNPSLVGCVLLTLVSVGSLGGCQRDPAGKLAAAEQASIRADIDKLRSAYEAAVASGNLDANDAAAGGRSSDGPAWSAGLERHGCGGQGSALPCRRDDRNQAHGSRGAQQGMGLRARDFDHDVHARRCGHAPSSCATPTLSCSETRATDGKRIARSQAPRLHRPGGRTTDPGSGPSRRRGRCLAARVPPLRPRGTQFAAQATLRAVTTGKSISVRATLLT